MHPCCSCSRTIHDVQYFYDIWLYMATVHFGSWLGLNMSAVRFKCAWATSLDVLGGRCSLLHRAGMALVMDDEISQHAPCFVLPV